MQSNKCRTSHYCLTGQENSPEKVDSGSLVSFDARNKQWANNSYSNNDDEYPIDSEFIEHGIFDLEGCAVRFTADKVLLFTLFNL